MFLPAGWWHQVINTEDTLAVTQNYVNRHCLKIVYTDTKVRPVLVFYYIVAQQKTSNIFFSW